MAIVVSLGLAGAAAAAAYAFWPEMGKMLAVADDEHRNAAQIKTTSIPIDDTYALARMLASEDRKSRDARIVVGWTALTRARRLGKSVYLMLTQGDGYGRQERDGKSYYAATSREPSPEDLKLADEIIKGIVKPSIEIINKGPGAWFERGVLAKQTNQKMSPAEEDARLLEKQGDWGEGVWGRLRGTNWFLFNRNAPILQPELVNAVKAAKATKDKDQIATARAKLAEVAITTLDSVPQVDGTDRNVA